MQDSQPQPSPSSSGHPPNQASSNKILLLVLIGVVSLLLVVGIIFGLVFILRDDDAADETGNSETSVSDETSDEEDKDEEDDGDEENEGSDDDTEKNLDISEAPDPAGSQLDSGTEDEIRARVDSLRQNKQEVLDLLESAGFEEYELQGFLNGLDDAIYLIENNSARFALLSEKEFSAWDMEIRMSANTYKEAQPGCEALLAEDPEAYWRCFKDASNRYGQELTLINKRYGLLD